MDKNEIKSLMSEHLKDLKLTAEECDEQFLTPITSAMIQTAVFLIQLNENED